MADAVAMMSARPLWVLPLAALLLHEAVRRDRALAAAIGFVGVLIVAQPGAASRSARRRRWRRGCAAPWC
ncbi:hypothetical protein [Teichococcus aestuarii]|uniref:hypothetical protein n=1 Tax=Teichococcus aestuarii TaxID=568898 RepID=UPI003615E6C3